MEWLKDTIWCVAVGASFFGYGLALLHILGKNPSRWLAAAGAGIGVITGLLGVMNLLSWIRPVPLVFLILIGDLLLFPLWRQPRPADIQTDVKYDPPARKRSLLKTITWAAFACVGCSALASFHNGIVNYFDDPQAYFAYPLEALQTGFLGSQPFSERRINTSLGANYLLDAVMAVDGDVRSGRLDLYDGSMLHGAAKGCED